MIKWFLFFLLLFSITPVFSKPLIVVIAGQSNALGRGETSELPIEYTYIPEGISYYKLKWGNVAVPKNFYEQNNFGPEVGLAFELRSLYPNKPITILKYAVGGTGIQTWLNDLYLNLKSFVQAFLNIDSDVSVAFVWVQGEQDGQEYNTASIYLENLSILIERIRFDFAPDVGEVKSIISKVSNTGAPYWSLVSDAQNIFVANSVSSDKVPTMDLSKIDAVHYDTQGQLFLGTRIAQTLRECFHESYC